MNRLGLTTVESWFDSRQGQDRFIYLKRASAATILSECGALTDSSIRIHEGLPSNKGTTLLQLCDASYSRFDPSRIPANTCCVLAKLVKLSVHCIFRHWKRKRKKKEKKKRLPSDIDMAHPQTLWL